MKNEKKDKKIDKKNMVDLTGHWFVNFGADTEDAKIEGSRILTINGPFDADTLMTTLTEHVQDSLPDPAKKILKKSGQKIVIRAFNRIDAPLTMGAVIK